MLHSALDSLRSLYRREPARVTAFAVAAIVALAARLNLILDQATVGQVVAVAVPILLGGEATRARVTPAARR